jgi:uncharacterized protein YbjQ (UPF0145 family)
MSEVQQDTDKIQKAAEFLADVLILGKKVYADKSIDLKDLQFAPEAVQLLTKAVELAGSFKEIGEEAKDLKGDEIVALVIKALELVEKVEEAK